MENNFFVGVISHNNTGIMHDKNNEKMVLYTEDNIYYTDLINEKTYSTDNTEKDYVLKDTLVEADVNDFNIDYLYLLNRFKENGRDIKKKKKKNIFRK